MLPFSFFFLNYVDVIETLKYMTQWANPHFKLLVIDLGASLNVMLESNMHVFLQCLWYALVQNLP
jgi:hypothetical protein